MTDSGPDLLECVINISEGRDSPLLHRIAGAGGHSVLDLHSDPDHHRSVLTLAGPAEDVEMGARAVAAETVARLDISAHAGAHPRIGALDVVPFVSLRGWPLEDGPAELALAARDSFARWACRELDLPCFLYGPQRSLPDVRRSAWTRLGPDCGPAVADPRSGACAVGARPVLVAYNLWLADADVDTARLVASQIRGPTIRALGLAVGSGAGAGSDADTGSGVQVSCNLIAPWEVGPGAVFDAVASRTAVARAELVGLLPHVVLVAEP